MTRCRGCGETLTFRYIDGRNVPLGCQCSAGEGRFANGVSISPLTPMRSFESYTIPDASCPVCGGKVFYYENSHGSKVFFDQLGPPWPKHFCTDNIPQSKGSNRVALKPYSRPKERYYRKGRKQSRIPDYPPFHWPTEKWCPFRIVQIIKEERGNYRYYTLSGIVNYDEFSLTLAPRPSLKIECS